MTLLLGGNGSGKTTVLRAIGLCILGQTLPRATTFTPLEYRRRRGRKTARSAVVTSQLSLHGIDEGLSSVDLTESCLVSKVEIRGRRDGDSLEASFVNEASGALRTRVLNSFAREYSPTFFAVGYSAHRLLPGRGQSSSTDDDGSLRYRRLAGLFEDGIPLKPLEVWFTPDERMHRHRREVEDLVNRLLPADVRFRAGARRPMLFIGRNAALSPSALSDGYRAYLGWVADLLYHLSVIAPDNVPLDRIPGVVLLDEIDLHLHPEWQRTVIGVVSSVFPSLQFIVTTHSPIVAGTVRAGDIYVMSVDSDGNATAQRLGEPIHGRNADQILLSPYFGLFTTRSPAFIRELEPLERRVREGDRDAAFEIMERLTYGSDPRQGRP